MYNRKEFTQKLYNVSNYQKLLASNIEENKVALGYYKIPKGYELQYKKDLNYLNNFDKNLLWDKKFWGINPSESISSVAVPTGNTLKYILKFALNK